MTKFTKHFWTGVVVLIMMGLSAISGVVQARSLDSSTKVLTANFEARKVTQVEVGEFHFTPGQVAPIHTHAAPAVGYVVKGSIIYQVEGSGPRVLNAGDVFYEPVGPRILRFDNASATQEAIFVDFNLEQAGEPFIQFEKSPTEAIDRRSLPTIDIDDQSFEKVEIYTHEIDRGGRLAIKTEQQTLGIVAEGVVEMKSSGQPAKRLVAGQSFFLPTNGGNVTAANTSSEVTAKLVTYRLQ